jgi:hypothetical protein
MPTLTETELLYREVRHLVGSSAKMPKHLTLEDVQNIMKLLRGLYNDKQ